MEPIIIGVLVSVAVYLVALAMIPPNIMKGSSNYTRSQLRQLEGENSGDKTEDDLSVLREQTKSSGGMARVFMSLPLANEIYPSLLKAGMGNKVGGFFIKCLVVLALALYAMRDSGVTGVIGSLIVSVLFGRWYIKRQIIKRNNAFITYFPDALDMIVRSIRSGYPMNSAIRMVADNMQPPVSTEFKQMADEIAYGSTLVEALQRLSHRIDEQDVRFFVVVLTVQQDIGGNLSEVLSNLSGVIRKRKFLRMKIKALASEGKATAWVLGSMPFVETLLILFVSPTHLTPLFTTPLGHTFLEITIGVAAVGILIVKKMVNIRV